MVAGYVSISACGPTINAPSVIATSCVGCIIFNYSSSLLDRLDVFDPVCAVSTNLFCGLWALVARGLFDSELGLLTSGNSELLKCQLVTTALIVALTLLIACSFFYSTNFLQSYGSKIVGQIVGDDLVSTGPKGELLINISELSREVRRLRIHNNF